MHVVAKRIAGYEIVESLGENAWGKSYRGRQVSLDRPVYLTVLPSEQDEPAIHSLARACAALTHPHLVSGIDLGVTPRGKYLVTELVVGPNIGDVVRRGGAIAEERALEIALAVAHALDYAARQGLIHGRVTPEAVVIAPGGTPKLRGFGADRDTTRSDLDWRSPEAKRGEATDVRADIWSLGAVLYWMLAAHYPFEDAPPPEVIGGEVVERPFPLLQVSRKLSPDTCRLVERMMDHHPSDRHGSAGELAEEIEGLISRLDDRVSFQPGRVARPGTRRARGRARRRRRR